MLTYLFKKILGVAGLIKKVFLQSSDLEKEDIKNIQSHGKDIRDFLVIF